MSRMADLLRRGTNGPTKMIDGVEHIYTGEYGTQNMPFMGGGWKPRPLTARDLAAVGGKQAAMPAPRFQASAPVMQQAAPAFQSRGLTLNSMPKMGRIV